MSIQAQKKMMAYEQNPTLQQLCAMLVRALPHIQAVYLFGSWGSEYQTANSDIDIAILLPPKNSLPDSMERANLSLEISGICAVDSADLVFLRDVNTVFQMQILHNGARILTVEESAADEFEMLTLSKYQKLNEERKDIIADGLKDGYFYAS